MCSDDDIHDISKIKSVNPRQLSLAGLWCDRKVGDSSSD